ncbi:MAG TPA: Gfo/Idh/MocA family oxidoreductase [Thermoanaerobaculia bacterium]|nr:Gfo/Idh/MocA family oxidoreductase [Thermoanaerobaculia bacterium]
MISRRRFLGTTGAAAAAVLVGGGPAGAQDGPLRLALIGTGVRGIGLWGRTLVRAYSDVVRHVGLCDPNPGRLAYAREAIGLSCPIFATLPEMIEATRPGRVMVTSVDATHAEHIATAMEMGCDVICEKPLCTTPEQLRQIHDAQERTGRDLIVTHNYRYSPHRARMKAILQSGRIGRLTSVDFHWYLNVSHGASYFRRWHGKERFSGTLFVHKASHHFDLLNWWIESEPETVYGQGALEHYGASHPFRGTRCMGCEHRERCDYFWDITKSDYLMNLYVAHEEHDGYIRDGCVWSEEIDIFDKMGAQIRYANGVQVSYSCTTYSPYEGYRIAFNGTEGRLEAWIKESQPWEEPPQDQLRVTENFGDTEIITVPHPQGEHGGADPRMLDRIFRTPGAPDPLRQAAGLRDGAMAVLIGFAARRSARTGEPVRIADLSPFIPQAARP